MGGISHFSEYLHKKHRDQNIAAMIELALIIYFALTYPQD